MGLRRCHLNAVIHLFNSCPLLIEVMHYSQVEDKLTFFGQDSDADARVTQFDEGGVPSPPVILSDQQNVFSADVPVDEMLFFLQVQKERESLLPTTGKQFNHSFLQFPFTVYFSVLFWNPKKHVYFRSSHNCEQHTNLYLAILSTTWQQIWHYTQIPTRKFMAWASCLATSSFHRMFIEFLFFFK